MRTSRSMTILSTRDLYELKEIIKKSNLKTKKEDIYVTPVGEPNREGEIIETKKGSLSAFLWGKKIKRGDISMNISINNGYKDPLFNDEDKVKIYYEIFASASGNLRTSRIFDTFKEVQRTIRTNNFTKTKQALRKILKQFKKRR